MCEAERRTVQELLTRYEFEPGLRDIYVEGPQDKALLEAFLEEHGVEGVCVFEISTVDVPASHGVESNSRTRLIRLARLLIERLSGKSVALACVIDSDFDHLSGHTDSNPLLLRTDYANMEMYFFSPSSLQKISRRCLRGRRITDFMINQFMIPTLQSLFVIRYVNLRPEWRLHCFSFGRVLSFHRGRFAFEREEYIRRYLNRNGRVREYDGFVEATSEVAIPSGQDARCFIHGHDFLFLLRWMLNRLRQRNVYGNEEVVFSILTASADYAALGNEPMFAELLRRFKQ